MSPSRSCRFTAAASGMLQPFELGEERHELIVAPHTGRWLLEPCVATTIHFNKSGRLGTAVIGANVGRRLAARLDSVAVCLRAAVAGLKPLRGCLATDMVA